MIDPAFKRRWLRALETPPDEGGYLKGTGYLVKSTNRGDRFCCLGVAANELIKTGEVSDWDAHYLSAATMLPPAVSQLIGITDSEQDDLANLNDDNPSDRFRKAITYIKEKL